MEWFSRNKNWVAGAFLATCAFVVRFLAVNQTSYASGWDGYYYVMQVHSWLTYGHLQSADFSPVYPFLAFISFFTDDYVIAFKVGQAMLGALLILSAYLYLLKTTGNTSMALLAGAYLTFSPTLVYLSVQFPKNVMGLFFLIWFIYFISRRNLILAAVFLVMAFLTHRMIGGFCLFIVLIYGARLLPRKYLVVTAVLLFLLSLLPGVLHFSDLQRLTGQFSWIPQAAPFSLYQLYKNSLEPAWLADLILASALIIFIGYSSIRERTDFTMEAWTWILLVLFVLFPFLTIKAGSIGFRFFFVSPVFIAIAAISRLQIKERLAWTLGIVLLGLSLVSYRSYQPATFDPPSKLYERITNRIAKDFKAEEYPLVIAHNGLAEMIIFKTDFDALNWAPPDNVDPNHVLRVVHNLEERHFRRVLGKEGERFSPVGPGYFIATEALWIRFLARLRVEKLEDIEARIAHGKNPMEQRPYFLSKGKDL